MNTSFTKSPKNYSQIMNTFEDGLKGAPLKIKRNSRVMIFYSFWGSSLYVSYSGGYVPCFCL